MNPRDYFKFERELQAGRDASGYGSVPLGAFQWGMWDYKRTGAGSHQDHSAMKVLDPVHPDTIDWAKKAQNLKGDAWLNQAPQWWQLTQPARDAVASQWQDNVTPHFPQNQIPFNRDPSQDPALQVASSWRLSKPFSHWWDSRKPIHQDDAKILAEYARGAHMSHSEATEYIDKHKSDVSGSIEDFKQRFFKEFSDSGFYSKIASGTSTPWFEHPLTKDKISGESGMTIMQHARNHFGWSTPQVWAQIANAGKDAATTE